MKAIASGPNRRIAVCFVEWATAGHLPAYNPTRESEKFRTMEPNATYASLAETAVFVFFVMTFANVSLPINRWASVFGAVLMPFFNVFDAGTSLLLTALVGGTLAYSWQRWRDTRQASNLGES